MPYKKEKVSYLLIIAELFGSFTSVCICYLLNNPRNEVLVNRHHFSDEVSINFPPIFQVHGFILLLLSIIGLSCIKSKI